MDADSEQIEVEEVESQEQDVANDGFDMESATQGIADDLFNHGEPSEDTEKPKEEVEEDESTHDDEVDEDEKPKEEVKVRDAPASWKKEMHETWASLTPEAQDYIEIRENQMKEGLDTDRADANLGRLMRDTISPYNDLITKQGLDPQTAVRNLMEVNRQLDSAPREEKIALINRLAQSYGLDLNERQEEVSPEIKSLQDKIQGLENMLNERNRLDQQNQLDSIIKEVEEFSSDPKHVYFEEIEGDIAQLITAGFSLEDAYEKAVWANPITRQKEMNRINEEKGAAQLEEARKKAEKLKKAKASTVKSRDTKYSPTEKKGTMADTMEAVMRDIQSR